MRARCTQAAGGSGSPAAAETVRPGRRSKRRATPPPHDDQRDRATAGRARGGGADSRQNSLLAVLDGPRTSALAAVLDDGPAMGADAQRHRRQPDRRECRPRVRPRRPRHQAEPARGGGGEHEGMLGGGGPLGTTGRFGRGQAPASAIGTGVGGLHARHLARAQIRSSGIASVRGIAGQGDHPAHRPPTSERGEVLLPAGADHAVRRWRGASSPSSPSRRPGRCWRPSFRARRCGDVSVEACVVNAVKRWEFPAAGPRRPGDGLLSVHVRAGRRLTTRRAD